MTLTVNSAIEIQSKETDEVLAITKKLLATKHYQTLGEAGLMAVISRARLLNLHPLEAVNFGFTCIQGKVGMTTEMMSALVRQRGHSVRKDPKSNDECIILHGKRKDNGDEWTCKFDKNDAIAAGLWGSATWKKYPTIMLYNRCMSQLFRQLFSDLSLGAGYVEDELREIAQDKRLEVDLNPTVLAEAETSLNEAISFEQLQEIDLLKSKMDPSKLGAFDKYIATLGFNSIVEITQAKFAVIKRKLELSAEDYQKNLKIQAEVESEAS